MAKKSGDNAYVVYMLKCADGTLYTGVTTDMDRRLQEHNEGGKGAKYTKARRPVTLAYSETATGRSDAQRREYEIRRMGRSGKEKLIL